MKIKKSFLNLLFLFSLFFSVSVASQEKELSSKVKVEVRGKSVYEQSKDVLFNDIGPFITATSASVEQSGIKGNIKVVNILDPAIDSLSVWIPAYNHDIYGTSKAMFDAVVSSHLAELAAGGTLALVGGTSLPVIGLAAGVGAATVFAYNKLDPIEGIKNYALGIKYPYHKTYNKAVVSLLSCDLNNANKQINLATKGCLMLLGKSEAKCISIKSKRSDYMKKYNIKGLEPKDTALFSQQSEEMIKFKLNLQSAEKEEKEHSYFLVKTLKFKADLKEKDEDFNMLRGYYRKQIDFIKNTSSGAEACKKYNALYSKLNECGKTFIETSAPSLMEEKKELMLAMNTKNNHMSLVRRNTLDNLNKSASCSNIDSILEKLANFQDKINQTNLYVYAHNDCKLKSTVIVDIQMKNVASILYYKRDLCRLDDRASADKKEATKEKKEKKEKKEIAIKEANCPDRLPGSTPKYYPDINIVECICVEPLVLNNAQSKCITKDEAKQEKKDIEMAEKKCDLNLAVVWNDEIGKAECVCLGPVFVWNKAKDECIPQDSKLLATYCDIKLPGSIPKNEVCVCPEGRELSKKLKICVEIPDANKTASKDNNKTLDQIMYRVSGRGYIPHWSSGSFEMPEIQHADFIFTLKELGTETYIQSIIDKKLEQLKSNPCDAGPCLWCGRTQAPHVWKQGPFVEIIRGPTSGLTDDMREKTWNASDDDGPSLSEIKEAEGCNK